MRGAIWTTSARYYCVLAQSVNVGDTAMLHPRTLFFLCVGHTLRPKLFFVGKFLLVDVYTHWVNTILKMFLIKTVFHLKIQV